MIPADIEVFTTEEEKSFYRFLHSVAKPDHKYFCWYLPDISGREPDFLLYSEKDYIMQGFEGMIIGILLGLAAVDMIGGPIRMAQRVAESLLARGVFNVSDIGLRYRGWWYSKI